MKWRSLNISCEYWGIPIQVFSRTLQKVRQTPLLRLSKTGGIRIPTKWGAFEFVVAVDDCQLIVDSRCGIRRFQAYWIRVLSMAATPIGEICQGCHCRLEG